MLSPTTPLMPLSNQALITSPLWRPVMAGGMMPLAENIFAASMPDEAFVEATGVVGDVYLLHPLMLHSASNNMNRDVRVITNPPVSIKEPFVFDRENAEEFSVVERKTLRALGKDRLDGWKIQGERQRLVPERVRVQEEMKKKEAERLKKLNEGTEVGGAKTQVAAVA